MVIGFFPVFSFEYFLQTTLIVSIILFSCFLLLSEKVLAVLSISSSSPNLNSSFSKTGNPTKVSIGLSWRFPLELIKIVTSRNPLEDKFFLSLIDLAS